MSTYILFAISTLLAGFGFFCIANPYKVKDKICNTKNMNIRLLGVGVLVIAIIMILQQITIGSLVHLLDSLKK